MVKSRWVIMHQTITITATIMLGFSVFYSVIFAAAFSNAFGLYCYESVECEDVLCMGSCCTDIVTNPACCCFYSEIPNKNETLLSYESFGKSVYSNMCDEYAFDNFNLAELYTIDCETQGIPEYIVYYIFKPPKAQA